VIVLVVACRSPAFKVEAYSQINQLRRQFPSIHLSSIRASDSILQYLRNMVYGIIDVDLHRIGGNFGVDCPSLIIGEVVI
jgi:hypothetical protein